MGPTFSFVNTLVPEAVLMKRLGGTSSYSVPKEGVVVSKIFSEIENNKERLHISDWGICDTSTWSSSSIEDFLC